MTRDVLIYTFETMADWEYAHISTVLQFQARGGDDRFRVRFVGAAPEPVRTLGGLQVIPDATLADIARDEIAMLVLPGGNTWADGHDAVLGLARTLIADGVPVAGICGATKAMARAGLLAHHAHVVDTDPGEEFPDYPGSAARAHGSVAADDPIVTAIGAAPLEFSREVFLALGLDDQAGVDAWYAAFKDVPDAR
ncbi:MAG: DJ-1/PfpI family protein [Dermatophilaceae bacterium]